MPGQYINYSISRSVMNLLRTSWSIIFMWISMHAASIMIVTQEHWQEGLLWNKRLPDKLIYYDAQAKVPGSEILTLAMIVAVLLSLYVACSSQPVGGVVNLVLCIPYIFVFLLCWLFTTFWTVIQMLGQPRDASWNTLAQFTFALLFKILIMANMSSVCLRAYVKIFGPEVDGNNVRLSTLNFGDRLSQIFVT